jgi:parvulin-like peptidyl-prolyl isomerase
MVGKYSFILSVACLSAALFAGEAETTPATTPTTTPSTTPSTTAPTAPKDEPTPEFKPLKVNGEAVSQAELKKLYDNLLHSFQGPGKPLTKPLYAKILSRSRENAVQREVVRQYLEQNKLVIAPDVLKEEFELKKADLATEGRPLDKILTFLKMSEAEFMEELRPVLTLSHSVEEKIDKDEVKAAFERGRANLALRRASQVLLSFDKAKFAAHPERPLADAQKLAASIVERARGGYDFAALAKEVSDDKHSKDAGGDLNFLKPSSAPKAMADALYKLEKVGDISEPIQSELGLHVLKFTEQHSEEDAFKKYLHLAANQKTSELINSLVKDAKVE